MSLPDDRTWGAEWEERRQRAALAVNWENMKIRDSKPKPVTPVTEAEVSRAKIDALLEQMYPKPKTKIKKKDMSTFTTHELQRLRQQPVALRGCVVGTTVVGGVEHIAVYDENGNVTIAAAGGYE